VIGGQNTLSFCHNRIEVILLSIYLWKKWKGGRERRKGSAIFLPYHVNHVKCQS
jgi:hypothetical protein